MNPEQRKKIIEDFIEYCKSRLSIEANPNIEFTEDREWAVGHRSFGSYNTENSNIIVYVGNRNLADTLRTLAHELVHHKQRELGQVEKSEDGNTGSHIENQANALAGVLMRDYGKINNLIYETKEPSIKLKDILKKYKIK